MGICIGRHSPKAEETQRSKATDKTLMTDHEVESRIIKLLLLGTVRESSLSVRMMQGESGKSTIFKQMQVLYSDGFSEYEKTTYRYLY